MAGNHHPHIRWWIEFKPLYPYDPGPDNIEFITLRPNFMYYCSFAHKFGQTMIVSYPFVVNDALGVSK